MKKLSTFLLALFFCLGTITAQTVDVSVNVVDVNGNVVNGATVVLYASTCDTAGYYNQGATNPNGYWNDNFVANCSQGTIDITVYCPDGSAQTATGSYFPGNYTQAFTLTCSSNTPTCQGYIGYTGGATPGEFTFELIGGNPSQATAYNWDFGDGGASTDATPTYTYSNDGYYSVLLTTSDNSGTACTYIDSIFVDLQDSTGCYAYFQYTSTVADPYTLEFYSSVSGATAPYTYSWDFGDNTFGNDANPVHTYNSAGNYVVTLMVTDANGLTCNTTYVVYVNDPMPQDTCYDWTVIDFGANCPGVDEVCGCDGVTYQNECIALNCFGIIDWTDGPCNGNGNGGGGTPIDSCDLQVGFQYTANSAFEFEFWGSAWNGNANSPYDYSWDFGDGTTDWGDNVTHTFAGSQDGIQAYTVCLTAFDIDSCAATACETIVLTQNPVGNFAGVIVEGANLLGDGEINFAFGPGDPMPNVDVQLLDANGSFVTSATTNAQGVYAFDGLNFGDYIIKVNIQGIPHAGEAFKLTPIVQTVPDLNFVVNSGGVTTGIDNVSFISSFEITPNPTSNRVNISLGMGENAAVEMTLTNLLGQTLVNEQLQLNKGTQVFNLDLSDYNTGIYLVTLRSGKEVITKKIVKQ